MHVTMYIIRVIKCVTIKVYDYGTHENQDGCLIKLVVFPWAYLQFFRVICTVPSFHGMEKVLSHTSSLLLYCKTVFIS